MNDNIRLAALKRIKPSYAEKKKVEMFSEKLLKKAKEISVVRIDDKVVSLPCCFVGSLGKGTWLSGDHDIDLFIIFPANVEREELEKKGLEIGRNLASAIHGKTELKYAEHPYVRIYAGNYAMDIVPCYDMKANGHMKSAVDRSPLHLEYVKQHIAGKEDDTRLLKQFCKASGVYGSDAKHLGISGYICELLIIKYGSFDKAINEISKWRAGVVITLNGEKVDSHKFKDQPLIVIDPVDKGRNAASVMSSETFVKMVEYAKEFLKKPSANWFIIKPGLPLNPKELKILQSRGTSFIAVLIKRPQLIDDIIYSQARRLRDRLESLLHYNEFIPLRVMEYVDEKSIAIIIEAEVWSLPEIKKMEGPSIFAHKHVDEFKKKYGEAVYVEGNNIYADVKRAHVTASGLLKDFFKKAANEEGVPKHLLKEAKGAKILEGKAFFGFVKKNKGLSAHIRSKYF